MIYLVRLDALTCSFHVITFHLKFFVLVFEELIQGSPIGTQTTDLVSDHRHGMDLALILTVLARVTLVDKCLIRIIFHLL